MSETGLEGVVEEKPTETNLPELIKDKVLEKGFEYPKKRSDGGNYETVFYGGKILLEEEHYQTFIRKCVFYQGKLLGVINKDLKGMGGERRPFSLSLTGFPVYYYSRKTGATSSFAKSIARIIRKMERTEVKQNGENKNEK